MLWQNKPAGHGVEGVPSACYSVCKNDKAECSWFTKSQREMWVKNAEGRQLKNWLLK
jgi:hypothetical protein